MKRFLMALAGFVVAVGIADAQNIKLKLLDWNVRSFEIETSTATAYDGPAKYIEVLRAQDADIITFNEFETGSNSRDDKELMSQVAAELGMYSYFVMSYPKNGGYYGNCILSKYPIVATASKQMTYKNHKGEGEYQFNTEPELTEYGADQRSVGYADILVPASGTLTRIRIVVSHFDHLGDPKVRARQAQESVDFASLADPVYPTIMMGDLNVGGGTVLDPLTNAGDHVGVNWVDHIYTFPKGAFTSSDFTSVRNDLLSDHSFITATVVLDLRK